MPSNQLAISKTVILHRRFHGTVVEYRGVCGGAASPPILVPVNEAKEQTIVFILLVPGEQSQ